MKPKSYEEAGVSVERGEAFAQSIARRSSPAIGTIGGFAGGTEIDLSGYTNPVLLSSTDGVGTKLLLARELDRYETIGIDLVAMCVNDLAVCGAQPLQFLDYIACGRVVQERLERVIDGVIAGCEQAGAVLAGGETAEMPDMYGPDDIDLAGFSVGLVERDEQLPHRASVKPGDLLLGLASSGIHSNGLSLARKVLTVSSERELLLEPTRIYVRELLAVRTLIKAAAHITGGGLLSNVLRVLPHGTDCMIHWNWQAPEVFSLLARSLPENEMRRTFNMGVGLVLVVDPRSRSQLESLIHEPLIEVGSVVEARSG